MTVVLVCWLSSPCLAQERALIVIHSDVATQIWTSDGKELGKSNKAFALNLDSAAKDGLTLVLKASGYQDKNLHFSRDELAKAKRLPPSGSYSMKSLQSQKLWWAGGLALAVTLLAGAGLAKSRGSRQLVNRAIPKSSRKLDLGPLLGEGNMARVYESKNSGPQGEKLAIKILRPEIAEDAVSRQRFLRELEVGLTLEHDNLARLFDGGEDEQGQLYLVLERLDGHDLQTTLEANSKPDLSLIREVALSVCSALIYLHDREIIHRDLKPANIFLTKSSTVKLVDLGIAAGADLASLTQTGMAVGTPYYMAPEQSSGEASLFSDQYSLGVLMFEMLTGQLPFPGNDAIEIVSKHLSAAPPSLCAIDSGVTALQEDVVFRMLSKEPTSRFPSIKEAREALDTALTLAEDCDDTMAFTAS